MIKAIWTTLIRAGNRPIFELFLGIFTVTFAGTLGLLLAGYVMSRLLSLFKFLEAFL